MAQELETPPAPPTVAAKAGRAVVLAALGVVFGDIGTSPLYALQTVFALDGGIVRPTPDDVYGVISLVFWSVTLIVSVKYVTIVMRADNDGEGGVMALTALVGRVMTKAGRNPATVILLGIVGASLFYGDSVITPAISVLSAVEGLSVSEPGLSHVVVPIAATILTGLFAVQRFGTHRVGALFGPVMLVWFAVLAVIGIGGLVSHPAIIAALLPTYAISFVASHPFITFVAMGAIVLCITGAEALYADMGHFGRPAIRSAWFWFVFPALTLNYLGQGALVLDRPAVISNPFFLLVPQWGLIPMVVLATAATVIASQAVISGAFSVSRQAMQQGLLPPLTVRQTSKEESGQVFLPAVNGALFVGVLVLMLAFQSSQRLATAYGVAVTGALLVDTVLLLATASTLWHWKTWQLVLTGVVFGGTELTFFCANLTKIAQGGWLPLLIAGAVFTMMTTWQLGRKLVMTRRGSEEGSLIDFVEKLHGENIARVPGLGVFPHPNNATTPLALRANVEHNRVLHQRVVIVELRPLSVPHVSPEHRLHVDDLGHSDDGIAHLTVLYGFSESANIPSAVFEALERGLIEPSPNGDTDVEQVSYFVSKATLNRTKAPGMRQWRKRLFIVMAHNAADPAQVFGMPVDRSVTMGSQLDI